MQIWCEFDQNMVRVLDAEGLQKTVVLYKNV